MINFLKQNSSDKKRFPEIDAIRGISALIILVHHYTKYIYNTDQENSLFLELIEYGKYTVHFFFVISGLLIFMSLEHSIHPKYFIVSRFSRLYPAYWACLALTALVITFSPYYNYHAVTGIQFLANLTMLQHWLFIEDVDGVYWTLAVEMCFYILIFIVFIFKKQKNIEWIGMGWLILMVTVYVLQKQGLLPPTNYYYMVPLLKNGNLFLAGIFFYQLKNNPDKKRKHGLILLCLAVYFILNPFEEALAISFIFLVLYLFVFGKLKFLKNRICLFLGYICYPLYLLHQYIGYEVINFLTASGIENSFLKITVTAIAVIVLATAVTFTIERPAMVYLRKRLLNKKRRSPERPH